MVSSSRLGVIVLRFTAFCGIAFLAYYSVSATIAQVVATQNPQLAHWLAPSNGRILARIAAMGIGPGVNPAVLAHSDFLALDALREDGLAINAVAVLAINAQLRGDLKHARHLLEYAQRMSRRELSIQLLMIEDAVARDDVGAAVLHYDTALRTNDEAVDLLFPILSAAITDMQIRRVLFIRLLSKPPWTESFLNYVADKQQDSEATGTLLVALSRQGIRVPEIAWALNIDKLVSAGKYDAAWLAFSQVRPKVNRVLVRDSGFQLKIESPLPFDWIISNDGNITSSRGSDGLNFSISAGASGQIAQQTQLLPIGIYVLSGRAILSSTGSESFPYWTLTCSSGRELTRISPTKRNSGELVYNAEFAVPNDCPIQTLKFVIPVVKDNEGISGTVSTVQFTAKP
jgi:hypothetical protein